MTDTDNTPTLLPILIERRKAKSPLVRDPAVYTIVDSQGIVWRTLTDYKERFTPGEPIIFHTATRNSKEEIVEGPLPAVLDRIIRIGSQFLTRLSNVLLLGLGGGIIHTRLDNLYPEAYILSVEIEPEVVYLARQHFFFLGNVVIADAFRYIKESNDESFYDLVLYDCYSDIHNPREITSEEKLLAILPDLLRLTSKGGVVLINILCHNTEGLLWAVNLNLPGYNIGRHLVGNHNVIIQVNK